MRTGRQPRSLTTSTKGHTKAQGQAWGPGGNPRGPRGGAARKFIFRGCWECGAEGHSRHECPDWLRILYKDGNPPPGHKGNKQQALDTWKANNAAKSRQKMKALGVHGEGKENDDDELSDGWEQPMRVFAIRECPPKAQVATTTSSRLSLVDPRIRTSRITSSA